MQEEIFWSALADDFRTVLLDPEVLNQHSQRSIFQPYFSRKHLKDRSF
jgi:hypothetical protein